VRVVFIIFLLMVFIVAYRAMTPEQRKHFSQVAVERAREVKAAATRPRPDTEAFGNALRERTSRTLVTPAIVIANGIVFLLMLLAPGALSDPDTLVRWGASFGPRTTNGEWWRIVTAMFVHAGLFQVLINALGLWQVGLMLERMVGHFSFAAAYLASGILANLVSLWMYPVGVSMGASGAVLGIYGLLIAWFVSGFFKEPTLKIPLRAMTRLVPATLVFIFYVLSAETVPGAAAFTGLATGVACGLVLMTGTVDRKPPALRIAAAAGATLIIAVASAVPLRGLADVRPEIIRIAEFEDRTSREYDDAREKFRKDRISAAALAQMIDTKILPELRAARIRLKAIDGVPPEHKPMVAGAEEYLRQREESWRLRAEGLRRTNMLKLRQAENEERASLEALHRVVPTEKD
jgi:rhomboid protease GluP